MLIKVFGFGGFPQFHLHATGQRAALDATAGGEQFSLFGHQPNFVPCWGRSDAGPPLALIQQSQIIGGGFERVRIAASGGLVRRQCAQPPRSSVGSGMQVLVVVLLVLGSLSDAQRDDTIPDKPRASRLTATTVLVLMGLVRQNPR